MATKDFVEFTPNSGNGSKSVSVTASNNTSAARTTVLTINAQGITKTITINQQAGYSNIIIVGGDSSKGYIEKIQLE